MKKFKNVLKYFVFVLILIPAMFLSACTITIASERSIVSIEKTGTNGLVDTYTITYSDDTTSTFTITNGKDGKDGLDGEDAESITITDVYNSLVDKGYDKSYEEFLQEYLTLNVTASNKTSIQNAILSCVSVYSEFKVNETQLTYIGYKTVKNTQVSAGSGVIYSLDKSNGDAYIITNYHVIYNNDANEVIGKTHVFLYGSSVKLGYKTDDDGNKINDTNGYPIVEYGSDAILCEYVGGSMNYDIAVLKISNCELLRQSDVKAVTVSDGYSVGDTAIAIGNPEAEGISVSQGIVSVESEYISMTGVDDVTTVTFRTMRIDTAINSGNSGGGLFNEKGELIGIVNAKIVDTEIENIAYAIPRDIVVNVADNLIYNYEQNETNKVNKVTIGLTLQIDSSKAVYNSETQTTKIVEQISIKEITENSIGKTAGFEVGDILISITLNDNEPYSVERIFNAIDYALKFKVGDSVTYTILRDGETQNITFTLPSDAFSDVD